MKLVSSLVVAAGLVQSATAVNICNALTPGSWTQAANANPKLQGALNELSKHAVATWYTDRWGDAVSDLLQKCSDGQVPSIVIYGLPNKDCADGYSSGGTNKDAAMYKAWIQSLVSRVGSRDVVYVLEPDAIGLLSNNYCAKQFNYLDNLKVALGLISAGNPNAKVYADVASWSNIAEATKVLNELKSAGRLNGVTINTSNYKTNDRLMSFCSAISSATGGLRCVFDTSRNHRGSVGDEWCNSRSAGIGAPPGSDTGSSLVDFNLWLKVPGESDGECKGRTPDAMVGPSAGAFFVDGFASLWDNSWFVGVKGLPKIGGNWGVPTPAPETPRPTQPPVVTTYPPTTAAPVTTTSAPATTTAPPTTATPVTYPPATTTTPKTEPPATTTAAPVTTSTPPLTSVPTTSLRPTTTEAPYTTAPKTTQAPTTTSPATSIPASTEPPATTTAAPYTEDPSTEEPSTESPYTDIPYTSAPSATSSPQSSTAKTTTSSNYEPADSTAETAPDSPASSAPRLSLPPSYQQASTQPPQQVNDISVSSTSNTSTMSASMIIMVSCIGMAGVVAMALVVVVYRKLNGQRERKEAAVRNNSIVVLGEHGTIHSAFDSTRCLQML